MRAVGLSGPCRTLAASTTQDADELGAAGTAPAAATTWWRRTLAHCGEAAVLVIKRHTVQPERIHVRQKAGL